VVNTGMSDITQQSFLNKAREDKFLLVFDVPPILKPSISDYTRSNKTFDPNSVQFSIFGTMVPQITVKGVETRFSGSTLYISSFSKDSPEPVSIDFKVDSMFSNYWVIYSWLNLLHDQKTGVYNQGNIPVDGNFNDYMVDMTIYGLDEYGKKRIKFVYKKAFPTTLNELKFNQQGSEGAELVSGFTFLYSQMHVELVKEM
jgi:hypothetical protein